MKIAARQDRAKYFVMNHKKSAKTGTAIARATIPLRFDIDIGSRFRRFFKRLLLNYWYSDSSLAKNDVPIAEILSEFTLHAAGMLSARELFARSAELTGFDFVCLLKRSGDRCRYVQWERWRGGKTKVARAGENAGLSLEWT